MSDFWFVPDAGAIGDLEDGPEVLAMLQSVGDRVAETAAMNAPKRTGAGAASIHAEVSTDEGGAHADVGWDRDHFYMGFAETGTERQSATPFLRPALDSTRI